MGLNTSLAGKSDFLCIRFPHLTDFVVTDQIRL